MRYVGNADKEWRAAFREIETPVTKEKIAAQEKKVKDAASEYRTKPASKRSSKKWDNEQEKLERMISLRSFQINKGITT